MEIGVLKTALSLLLIAPLSASLSRDQEAALQFYIPIYCQGQPWGTGFPVNKDLVMTAAHIRQCPDSELELEIAGKRVQGQGFSNNVYDVAIFIVPVKMGKTVKFRAPRLGEKVSGFGIARLGIMSTGIIAQVEPEFLLTNIPIGGMSGSAVFGTDGKAVGMVTFGWPDERVGGTVSGGHSGALLKTLLDSFNDYRKTLKSV
jgi:hypothetical protein